MANYDDNLLDDLKFSKQEPTHSVVLTQADEAVLDESGKQMDAKTAGLIAQANQYTDEATEEVKSGMPIEMQDVGDWARVSYVQDAGQAKVIHGVTKNGSVYETLPSTGFTKTYDPTRFDEMQDEIDSIGQGNSAIKSTIVDFVDTLSNPLKDVSLVVIGASVEWGLTLPENSTSTPRSKLLSDPRDNLDSPSYVNILRKWFGHGYLDIPDDAEPILENAPGSSTGGSGYFTDPNQAVEAKYDKRIKMVSAGGVILPRGGSNVSGASVLDPLEVPAGASIMFDIHGDNFEVVYGTTIAGGNMQVFVDDVAADTKSYTGAVSWQQSFPVSVPVGSHSIRVRNDGTGPLRIELIKRTKTLRVVNQGIIGAGVNEWRPDAVAWFLLTNCLSPDANFAIINLGSNDRAATLNPQNVWKVKEYKRNIIRWLAERGVKSMLGGSSPASPDFPNTGASYKFSQLQIGRINRELAQEEGVFALDRYVRSINNRWIENPPTWEQYLVPGDNHPNALGHRAIADSWTEQFIKYTDL